MSKSTTLETLMARGLQRQEDKLQTKMVKLEKMGIEVALRKPPLKKITDLIDEASEEDSTYGALLNTAAIVYEAWPLLHDNFGELKKQYEANDPYEMTLKMFDGCIDELNLLSEEVLGFYGIDLANQIKNL